MKYIISLIIILMLIPTIFIATSPSTAKSVRGLIVFFDRGKETAENPYIIMDVHDLQNISTDLSAHYILNNNINASETKKWNSGAGFIPIGVDTENGFTGTLDGRNFTISGLYINRSTDYVGLFGSVGHRGLIKNLFLDDNDISGVDHVGGLVGINQGKIINSTIDGNIVGNKRIGGLVGENSRGLVKKSYATGNTNGRICVGGLIGLNTFHSAIEGSYANGITVGNERVGALVGENSKAIINKSYATGYTIGMQFIGGLVGLNYWGAVENSYATVNTNGRNYVGGLIGDSVYYSTIQKSYATGNVVGNDKVGGLVGENSKGTIRDSYATGNTTGRNHVGGLTGCNKNSTISDSYATGNINGNSYIGGLTGYNEKSTINNSFASGTMIGNQFLCNSIESNTYGTLNNTYETINVVGNFWVGGLVGFNYQSKVRNSYAIGNITGNRSVGGLVGRNEGGMVFNSYYDVDHVFVNGDRKLTRGGIFTAQFKDWLSSRLSLDISDYCSTLVPSDGYFNINNVQGLKDLLGFSDNCNYKFRLSTDIDLSEASGLYIPFFKGAEFNGNNHTISNIHIEIPFNNQIGMFGFVEGMSKVKNLGLVNINITGYEHVGGLIGYNQRCMVNSSYTTGCVRGAQNVGGLIGTNFHGKITNTYSLTDVIRSSGSEGSSFGGFVGTSLHDNITFCFSTGHVFYEDAEDPLNKGFIGSVNIENSFLRTTNFWDIETSFQKSTAGNANGKNTTEMKTRNTFTEAGWDYRNTWFMLEGVTYPLLRCQDKSKPIANAGPDIVIDEGDLTFFNGNNSMDDIIIRNYTWSFIDGILRTLYNVNPSYQFKDPGIYIITLNVTDAVGKWNNDNLNVLVKDSRKPIADAGPDQIVKKGVTITFEGNSSWDNVDIVNYSWTFIEDDTPVTLYGIYPSYQYNNSGVYIITLNVTDAEGNWDVDTFIVNVYNKRNNSFRKNSSSNWIFSFIGVLLSILIVIITTLIFFFKNGKKNRI
ncbi:MAG: PKD domain-containing protein [Candidatus Lokiarchaeota archaeon]|nr:PKD domain-containing protein [Candidatus Lokiarchaeota archaeon]